MSTDKLDKRLTDLLIVVEKTLHITILFIEFDRYGYVLKLLVDEKYFQILQLLLPPKEKKRNFSKPIAGHTVHRPPTFISRAGHPGAEHFGLHWTPS